MNYKEKFAASEHRAHYKNIATKILRDMNDLRAMVENSPTASRRWVWELIQNAKDVHPEHGTHILIDHSPNSGSPYLKFLHNGRPFTADNIRFLIEQISTKDRKKDEYGRSGTTGKFGTGFLATHLLSEKVTVSGVAKEPELEYQSFKMELDRSGYELEEITDAVERAKIAVNHLDESPPLSNYDPNAFNTEFHYNLDDALSLKVAKTGIDDLLNCLHYTFVFVPEIKSVQIPSLNRTYLRKGAKETLSANLTLQSIMVQGDGQVYSLVTLQNGLTTIAVPIRRGDESFELVPIEDNIPRLFCDFPLVGTEVLELPIIINNPNFNPTNARDGVALTQTQRHNIQIEENQAIILEAIELYYELLEYAIDNKWGNLHLLAHIRHFKTVPTWVDNSWYEDNVLWPIRRRLLKEAIVTNASQELVSILNQEGQKYVWFPSSGKKENRAKIWELANQWFPYCLPRESDIELWNRLTWDECGRLDVTQFAIFIENKGTLEELQSVLLDTNVHDWLNNFYKLIKIEERHYDAIINNYAIFPNQNGDLCKKEHLCLDNGDIDEKLKDILNLLDSDIRSELLDIAVMADFDTSAALGLEYAVREITTEVQQKTVDRELAKDYRDAFRELLLWFNENPERAKNLFPALYRAKHLLYDEEEIMENITKAEQLSELLQEYNVENINQLRELIASNEAGHEPLLPITQEILSSMGITSIEEWTEALKDKNLAELFAHESVPTTDMFLYVQSHIRRCKTNIIAKLETLENYDLSGLDDSTAPTILAGIIKDGQEISIVARPAYNGEVIIYYGSERDILDFEPSELWIDDGVLPKRISLGHILKKSGITKFPV